MTAMNWEKVHEFVDAWVHDRGLPADMSGKAMILVDFEDEKDCEFFYPGRDMISHKAFTSALAKVARGRKARTEHSTIHREHYSAWLLAEKLEDSVENRARFIESRYQILSRK